MSEFYVGEIRPFAGNFAPVGWALCDGSLLSIAQWQVLFTLIGTTYGGDGQTTFGLPDLRGRAVIHQGQGPGLSNYVMGQPIGVENATVSTGQMPSHPHSLGAWGANGNVSAPGPGAVLAGSPTGSIYATGAATTTLSAAAVTATGGSAPHANRQPYQAITYIIALEGIYPSQN